LIVYVYYIVLSINYNSSSLPTLYIKFEYVWYDRLFL